MSKKVTLMACGVAALLTAYGCGGGGSSSSNANTSTTRGISGTLSGDLSGVSTISAVNTATGAKTTGAIAKPSNAGRAAGASTYSIDLTTGESYNITLEDASGNTVANLEWPAGATAADGTTTVVDVTDGADVDLGDTSVPAGVDATTTTLLSSTNNPLESTDVDGDGTADFSDTDDDGDGTADSTDTDDDGDGVADATQETDGDNDGTPDTEDLDAVDADIDDDGSDNSADADDDNDGTDDVADSDVDGDGEPNTTDSDVDGDNQSNAADSDVDGDGEDNSADTDDDGDGTADSGETDANNDGVSDASTTIQNLSAQVDNGTAALEWDEAYTAASYNVYWGTTAGVTEATGTKISAITDNKYDHTGLAAGTYYYVVTAVDGDGAESAISSEVSVTIP